MCACKSPCSRLVATIVKRAPALIKNVVLASEGIVNAYRADSLQDRLDREQHSDRGHGDDDQFLKLLVRGEGQELLDGLVQYAEKRRNSPVVSASHSGCR